MVTYLHAVTGEKIIAVMLKPHDPWNWEEQDDVFLVHMPPGSHLYVDKGAQPSNVRLPLFRATDSCRQEPSTWSLLSRHVLI